MTEKARVLFLCTHNSARLQMAEGLLAMIPPFLDAPTPEAEPSAWGRDARPGHS